MNHLVWTVQKGLRFCLNGRCYPKKPIDENFRDYYIGWISYKYFSKFKLRNLNIDFMTPKASLIYVIPDHSHAGMFLTLKELKATL